jgi:hypothetical protein
MPIWYRVFGGQAAPPEPAGILEHLNKLGIAVRGQFTSDTDGWFHADLVMEDGEVHVERFLASEEGIRAELNSWAAWIETCEDSAHYAPLLEQMIQATQLFTLESPGGAALDGLALALCQYLARATAGLYQVDGQGLFTAEGNLLVRES